MVECKWYRVCPIRRFVEEGKIERRWVEEYCLRDFRKCIRFQLEERGISHPDEMLPNGELREELSMRRHI
ncbi:uracil-DNA glycosylase [archaeon]|nr:MAG: uracil-DNA glycosylase [archaeon]